MTPVCPPLTRAQAAAADRYAEECLGLPASLLMENAGRGLSDVTFSVSRCYGFRDVLVVAGKGNNGGDGLVAARHLRARGVRVRVLLPWPASGTPAPAEVTRNLEAVRALGIPVLEAPDGPSLRASAPATGWPGVLVDALLGTGLRGTVRGQVREALELLSAVDCPVVAADLPSGLDADTGEAHGPVPRCVATATFLAPKAGLTRGIGPVVSGRIHVCGLGFPPEAVPAAAQD